MSEKYISKYSNGKAVSAAQFITEIICERKAEIEKTDLHYRFWLQQYWEKFYRNQIASAHKLLKKYPHKAIVKALQSPAGRKIYSLRAPHLPGIIEQQALILSKENTIFTKEANRKPDVSFQKKIQKKNIISKLKDIDNGTEG